MSDDPADYDICGYHKHSFPRGGTCPYCDDESCKHLHMQVIPNAEGDLSEERLTRRFTTYYCPDCDYEAESPPLGWEPNFDEPYEDEEPDFDEPYEDD